MKGQMEHSGSHTDPNEPLLKPCHNNNNKLKITIIITQVINKLS